MIANHHNPAAIDALLPQTQCTKCGYPDCRRYAEAIADGKAGINQCPPGGAEGIRRLAALLGRPVKPLDPAHGSEEARGAALIDEAACIGCTLCIRACPVDAIVGGPKLMHTVLVEQCTGCGLCLPPCPVDCIEMLSLAELGRRGSSQAQAEAAVPVAQHAGRWRERYRRHEARRASGRSMPAGQPAVATAQRGFDDEETKRAAIDAALARARIRRARLARS